MQETTSDVRRDIEETRARVSQALAELDGEISTRTDAVRESVTGARDSVAAAATQVQSTIVEFAHEHPWYALGIAVGLGVVIARSGADEAAVRGVAGGASAAAKGVAGAATGAAKAGIERAKGLVGSSAEEPDPVAAGNGGLLQRLEASLVSALTGSELMAEIRREAGSIGRQ